MLEKEQDVLQKMQLAFCKTQHIHGKYVKRGFEELTQWNGTEEEISYIQDNITTEMEKQLFYSFVDDDAENVIEITCQNDGVLYCGIAIRGVRKEILGVWMLCGLLQKITKTTFFDAVALAETLSQAYLQQFFEMKDLADKLFNMKKLEHEKDEQLKKTEVITEIMKMLESENEFGKISDKILEEVGTYLEVSEAILYQKMKNQVQVSVISGWKCDGTIEKGMTKREQLPFFTERPYTISSNVIIPEDFKEYFEKKHIKAGVFLPIQVKDETAMYLAVLQCDRERRWTVEESRFLNDVKRILQTIVGKRIVQNSLVSSYTALESILENAGCGISINDTALKKLLYRNDAFREMFQEPEDICDLENIMEIYSQKSEVPREFYSKRANRWFEINLTQIPWVDERQVILTTVYEITHIKMYQQKIEHQANVDYLTGLYNRMRCEKDLKNEIREAARTGKQGALLYIDLDDFKNINDGLGHHLGDVLLGKIASELKNISQTDDHCYRVGGDEFVLILSASKEERFEYVIKRVREIFLRPWELGDTQYYCTMSMGVVTFLKDGTEADELLKKADMALSTAKMNGKNRIAYFNEAIQSNLAKRLEMEKCLRKAVDEGCREFELYYQPLMNIRDGKKECCGAEALVRWNSKELGFVMPSDFIPLAEYLGLIVPIGNYILLEACRRCKYWNDFGHPEYKINVNLSVIQLLQSDVVEMVRSAVQQTQINPHNLTLEITEGLAIHDMNRTRRIFSEIRDMGVRVALDDFGTGYSSLKHLKDIPLDVIKIDRCFVTNIGDDEFSEAFVKSVSDLADAIHVNVCAEGVEEVAQCDSLQKMKVDMLQGFLFDQPLQAEAYEQKYLY